MPEDYTNISKLHREAVQGLNLLNDIQSPPPIIKKNLTPISPELFGPKMQVWPNLKGPKITIQKPPTQLPEIGRNKQILHDASATDSVPEPKPRRMSFQQVNLPIIDKSRLNPHENASAVPSLNPSPGVSPRTKRSTFAVNNMQHNIHGNVASIHPSLPSVRREGTDRKTHMQVQMVPVSNAPQITAGLENLLSKMKAKETFNYKMVCYFGHSLFYLQRKSTNIKGRANDYDDHEESTSSANVQIPKAYFIFCLSY